MLKWPTNIYRQAVVVLDSSSGAQDVTPTPFFDEWGNRAGTIEIYHSPMAEVTYFEPEFESVIFKTTFSSVPVVWESELHGEYKELGEALSEMVELDEEDEWKIEPPVYTTACYIAAGLMDNLFPAPRIFSHGPKSVVFNWSQEGDNLYLTISADAISAMISSPERIKRRVDYSASELVNPSFALSSIRAAFSEEPIKLLISGSVSDPPELASIG